MPLAIDVELFKKDPAALDAFLQSWIGEKMNTHGTNLAPDPVNMPMIRHWIECVPCRTENRPVTCGGDYTCMQLITGREILASARELLERYPPEGHRPDPS